MSRRPPLLALLAGTLVSGTLAGAVGSTPAFAASGSGSGSGSGSKRVCSVPTAGHAACDARVRTKGGQVTPAATTSYNSGYAPAQLKSAYGLTGVDAHATVAVVDAYANPNAAADLATYRGQFGLGTANLTQYNQTGAGIGTVGGDTGWGQEEMLDLEMVSAICPGCTILYVGASSSSFADLAAAVNTAVAKGATVVSNSYGGAESSAVRTYAAAYNHPGVAITVSSGDNGYGVESPASYGTVTAVGGTSLTLNADGTRRAETVWNGAGSGCSAYVAKPSWQHDTACSRRTVADVAAVADPATGVAVYDSYGSTGGANWYVFGGTSVAAPIVGGVYALSGNTAGVPAQLAYTNHSSLFDVTSGSNGSCSRSRLYLCTGGTGYDGPTGNGAPVGTGAF